MFGEVEVVTDDGGDSSGGCVVRGWETVAGFEDRLLVVPQVGFSVDGADAGGVDDCAAVCDSVALDEFAEPADDDGVVIAAVLPDVATRRSLPTMVKFVDDYGGWHSSLVDDLGV